MKILKFGSNIGSVCFNLLIATYNSSSLTNLNVSNRNSSAIQFMFYVILPTL